MRMSSSQRNLAILLGVVVGLLFWLVALPALVMWWDSRAKEGFAVSPEQVRRIADAIAQYEKANGERPMQLTELVEAGLLDPGALLDERRDEPKDGADVLYFPAVRRDDLGDLVLLCTLLVRSEGDSFHVITNDGRYTEMPARDLAVALNRTYTYIGNEIIKARSASAPAATDRTEKE